MFDNEDTANKAAAAAAVSVLGNSCVVEKMKKREDLACRVYVGGLRVGATEADVRKAFARSGEVVNVVVKSKYVCCTCGRVILFRQQFIMTFVFLFVVPFCISPTLDGHCAACNRVCVCVFVSPARSRRSRT